MGSTPVSVNLRATKLFTLFDHVYTMDSRYYFPTYENDALLCLLEDAKEDESTETDQVRSIFLAVLYFLASCF